MRKKERKRNKDWERKKEREIKIEKERKKENKDWERKKERK